MTDGKDMLVLEPVTQQFIDSLAGQPQMRSFQPDAARTLLLNAQSAPIGKPRARTDDKVFPVGPTGSVDVRIVRPPDGDEKLPIVMLFHGGGSMLGDKETHDRLMREIAVGVRAAVIFVGYDRAPQSRFPVAIEQAYAATSYAVAEADALGLDPTRLAVVGDSVGGNIAAVVALLAKERRGPRIVLQVLLYPVTDADFNTSSYRRFADGPWLTRAAMCWFWDAYLPDIAMRQDFRATPLNATTAQLRNLPDALVIVAQGDVLRDEGEAYAQKLSDAGVRVTSVRFNGTIHDFVLLHALADTPATRGAIAQMIHALSSALG
jgi:acetyl esterase